MQTSGVIATVALVMFNVAVHVAAQLGVFQSERFALQPSSLAAGEWWRLLTAMCLHLDWKHLGFNCLLLLDLGFVLGPRLGATRLLAVYWASGLAGNLSSTLFLKDDIPRVGASGAILGLAGAALVHVALSEDLPWSQRLRFIRGAALMILANVGYGFIYPGVDNGAHVGGVLFGALSAAVLAHSGVRAIRPSRQALLLVTGPAIAAAVIVASLPPGASNRPSVAVAGIPAAPTLRTPPPAPPAPPPPPTPREILEAMVRPAQEYGQMDCAKLEQLRVMWTDQCRAFQRAIDTGRTDGSREQILGAMSRHGYVELTGQVVAHLEAQTYEVTAPSRLSTSGRALLSTNSFEFRTTGRFALWVRKIGTRWVTTRNGNEQEWPEFEENDVGAVYSVMRAAPAGYETTRAAKLLAAALIATVAAEK